MPDRTLWRARTEQRQQQRTNLRNSLGQHQRHQQGYLGNGQRQGPLDASEWKRFAEPFVFGQAGTDSLGQLGQLAVAVGQFLGRGGSLGQGPPTQLQSQATVFLAEVIKRVVIGLPWGVCWVYVHGRHLTGEHTTTESDDNPAVLGVFLVKCAASF